MKYVRGSYVNDTEAKEKAIKKEKLLYKLLSGTRQNMVNSRDDIFILAYDLLALNYFDLSNWVKAKIFFHYSVNNSEIDNIIHTIENGVMQYLADFITGDTKNPVYTSINTKGFGAFVAGIARRNNIKREIHKKFPTFEKDECVLLKCIDNLNNKIIIQNIEKSIRKSKKADKLVLEAFIKAYGDVNLVNIIKRGLEGDISTFEVGGFSSYVVKRLVKKALIGEIIIFADISDINLNLINSKIIISMSEIFHEIKNSQELNNVQKAVLVLNIVRDENKVAKEFSEIGKEVGIDDKLIKHWAKRLKTVTNMRSINVVDKARKLTDTEMAVTLEIDADKFQTYLRKAQKTAQEIIHYLKKSNGSYIGVSDDADEITEYNDLFDSNNEYQMLNFA